MKATIKYPVGTPVRSLHAQKPLNAIVTGILVKKNYREYQCSYIDEDGDPKFSWLQECEIEPIKNSGNFGFKGNKK